ncbi:N-acetyl-gamma-glutamyl-phosphate reductase [bacterium]|nr:MAG: N-acetyl-gamma-glutamyl-phosphate reductase [bacterium]
MTRPAIFIDGEAGTTGLQIHARLRERDDLEIVSIAPGRRKDEAERRRLLNAVDVAVLCLPDDAAREAVGMIANPNVRVLDASTAHRVDPAWVYGFPEMLPGQDVRIRKAARVSNPGCYSTGAIALVRPLVDAGLLPREYPLAINAISGYSGGGRRLIEAFESSGSQAIADPYYLYALGLAHKHVPEMRLYGGLTHTPLFSPSVGVFRQGMLVQVPLQLWSLPGNVSAGDVHGVLSARYEGQRFVRVAALESPPARLAPESINGTNQLELFVFENTAERQALLVARLDNLGKGASGAAVQNIDLMLGLQHDSGYELEATAAVG